MNIGILRSSHLHFHVSTAKAEKEIGYKPLFSTKEAIDRTVEYLRTLNEKITKEIRQKEKNKKEQELKINQGVNINQEGKKISHNKKQK
jgi:hypothetical protein